MSWGDRSGFIVRVRRSGSGAPAGVGFVVDERRILTCAHVVNTALGLGQRAQDKPGPGVRVEVDFPILGGADGAPSRSCRVEAWVPPPLSGISGGDVAGLVIIGDELPVGAGPARLMSQVNWERLPALVYGFPGDPPRQDHGALAAVHTRGLVGGGIIQLDPDSESAFQAQPGYSGSPVVADDDGGDVVAGMLVAATLDGDPSIAYAIPVSRLAEAWPKVMDPLTLPECPYRGLAPFTADDATAIFVGREEEISDLRQMVGEQSLVMVTGPSGVGKSSLVNAGLIPAVQREGWLVPPSFRPGASPIDAMARALLAVEQPSVTPTLDDLAAWLGRLRSDGLTAVGSRLARLKRAPVLLHVDQLEEIFDRDVCPADLKADFLDLLLSAQASGTECVRVVCTLRADFLPRLLEHPDAGTRLRGQLFTLSPMGRNGLERVIAEPAAARGVGYEDGLVSMVARDADGTGGLPLLEFALTELWPHQCRRQITLAAYQGIGAVAGALSGYAERVLKDLCERFAEERIRRVILALVRSRSGATEATRHPVSRDRLGTDWEVAETLAQRRLLVISHDPAKDSDIAEIAHEALIREWPRLAIWVDDDADFQHWLTIMEERLADGELLPDARIAEADRWLAERSADIPDEVKRLVEDSKSEWQRRADELEEARNRAEAAARQAEVRRLAAAAELALASRGIPIQIPIALAIESLRMTPGLEGDIALRHAIRLASVQRARLDHNGLVWAVAFSPDGARVATASWDGSARVFDAATGTQAYRLDHDGRVNAVAFSPDGARVATASGDGAARVFDAVTGERACRLEHRAEVWAVAFSPDGTQVATASADGKARVFDAANGTQVCRMDHDGPVWAVVFSPDGTRAATACADGKARVFDAATGALVSHLDHDGPVNAVRFSPDGARVATASDDGTARVFGAAAGTLACRMDHGTRVWAVAFSPDGNRVATGSIDGGARVFEIATGMQTCRLDHDGEVRAVAFSSDGTQVATASWDGTARVFDPATGTRSCGMAHDGPVWAVAFSPDGTRVATASGDGTARVFDAAAGTRANRMDSDGPVDAVAFSPDGRRVATASGDGTARVFDASTGARVCLLDHDGRVSAVAFGPDGVRVATASADGSARVFDASTGAQVCRLDHDGPVWAVAFGPDGVRVATASADGSARVFDASTGAQVCRLDHDTRVWAVVFSPDGTRVATASDDGTARVFDAATGTLACRLDHDGPVNAVAFSPDGARVATASDDGAARVFDAATGTLACRLDHDTRVWAVVFSPDGTRVATASDDGTARVFDAATGTLACRLDHDGPVNAVAFSPDGARVATASIDGSARVFEIATRTQASRLDHDGEVRAVAFSPDGTRVATASADHSTRVWTVDHELLVKQAEGRLTRNLTQQEWRRYFSDEPYRKTRADLP